MDKQQEIMSGASARDTDAGDGVLALPVALSRTDAFHNARLLLSHFNMVDYDQRAMFSMLECGTPLQRSINTLDAKRAREAFKIGLIYVRRGQDSQEQILKNDTRSQHYDAFVKALAWEVNMVRPFASARFVGTLHSPREHAGHASRVQWRPGPDQVLDGHCGAVFCHHAAGCVLHSFVMRAVTLTLRAIFRMRLSRLDAYGALHKPRLWSAFSYRIAFLSQPTDTKDEQQIHKKRHVGNDVVNVVYSEHVRDYDPSTISTQFNCEQRGARSACVACVSPHGWLAGAHVILYPLPNGLTRVQVCRKEEQVFPLFGPLLHNMCVTSDLLPIMARQTRCASRAHSCQYGLTHCRSRAVSTPIATSRATRRAI